MIDQNTGLAVMGGVELMIHRDGDVEIEMPEAQFGYVPLADLEQFVNEARAYLDQPVLADEVLKLKDFLGSDSRYVICPTDGKPGDGLDGLILDLILGKINDALRAMGKLE